jgi:hypothetical protein
MNTDEALRFVEDIVHSHQGKRLNDLQRAIFRGAWQGQDYKEISKVCDQVGVDHLMRNVGPQLWKMLSGVLTELLEEPVKVSKASLQGPIERLHDRLYDHSLTSVGAPVPLEPLWSGGGEELDVGFPWQFETVNRQQDWGQAPDVTLFRGRTRELSDLQQWIEADGCRLVTLYGMAGIGKTAFSVKLAEQLRDRFEVVIWRSLDPALSGQAPPPLPMLLADLIQVMTDQPESQLDLQRATLQRFLEYLRTPCLIVLDGIEAVLKPKVLSGNYGEGYEGYGELLRRLGETHHHSCLILTGSEKPREIETREGSQTPVRSHKLHGLLGAEAQSIFLTKGDFFGTENDWRTLIHQYDGNPRFLQEIATTITHAFGRDIGRFLSFQKEHTLFVGEIRTLLAQQLDRLSDRELEIVKALSANREPAALEEVQALLPQTILSQALSPHQLLEILLSLGRRSLLETHNATYHLHPLVMAYLRDLNFKSP